MFFVQFFFSKEHLMRNRLSLIPLVLLFACPIGCSPEASNDDGDENYSDTGDSSAQQDTDTMTSENQISQQYGSWNIQMSADATPSIDSVGVTVLDEAELNNRGVDSRLFLDNPVEIRVNDALHARLDENAIITMAVDKSLIQEDTDLIYVAYWTGSEWTYYLPDVVDAEAGTVCFHTDHFSLFVPTKLTRDEFYEKYSRALAVNNWQQNATRVEMINVMGSSFDDALFNLGVRSAEARRQMINNIMSTDSVYDALFTMTTGTNEQFN
jgi:hypothetical protein